MKLRFAVKKSDKNAEIVARILAEDEAKMAEYRKNPFKSILLRLFEKYD